MISNSVVDFLYKLSPSQWESLQKVDAFKGLSNTIQSTSDAIANVNNFLGMNISDTPLSLITSSFKSGSWLLLIAAVLIPVLAYVTQVLNYKLMPQPDTGTDTTAATMKSMNLMMPLMSAVFCLSLPVGIGIYWIAGAVIRTLQQIFINRHLNKMDMDEMIRQNKEAAAKKMEKKKEVSSKQVSANAHKNVKKISNVAKNVNTSDDYAGDKNSRTYKEGSIAAKANMVRKMDEKK
jgi:YidC/Oxa1 family membrane protein insertase